MFQRLSHTERGTTRHSEFLELRSQTRNGDDVRKAAGRVWTRNPRVLDPSGPGAGVGPYFAPLVCGFGDPKLGGMGSGLKSPPRVPIGDPKPANTAHSSLLRPFPLHFPHGLKPVQPLGPRTQPISPFPFFSSASSFRGPIGFRDPSGLGLGPGRVFFSCFGGGSADSPPNPNPTRCHL